MRLCVLEVDKVLKSLAPRKILHKGIPRRHMPRTNHGEASEGSDRIDCVSYLERES